MSSSVTAHYPTALKLLEMANNSGKKPAHFNISRLHAQAFSLMYWMSTFPRTDSDWFNAEVITIAEKIGFHTELVKRIEAGEPITLMGENVVFNDTLDHRVTLTLGDGTVIEIEATHNE